MKMIIKKKLQIKEAWHNIYLPGAYTWEDDESPNPYDGVLEKEYRLPWYLERYINELDRIQEEREWNKKKKRRS